MRLAAASRIEPVTRWLNRDGAAVSWREAGVGPEALVFLHAFPLNATMWEAAWTAWKDRFRILCPIWRGFDGPSRLSATCDPGQSVAAADSTVPVLGPEEVTPSLEVFVEDVAAICSVAGIRSATVVGCSLGGYVLFGLRRRFPRLVRAAVFCDTRPEPDSAEARTARFELNHWLMDMVQRAGTAAAGAALAERMIGRLLGPTTLRERPQVVSRVRNWIEHAPADAVTFANAAMAARPDSRPQLAAWDIPVLVMAGEEDQLIPPAATRSFAAQIPGAAVKLVPGAGHLLPLEDPAAFDQALRQWMDERKLL